MGPLDFNNAPDATPALDRDAARRILLENLPQALTWLFPAGVEVGHTFQVGSIRGEQGRSLEVELTGERAGLWIDRATGDGGDIFDLWAAARSFSTRTGFGEVLADIAGWHRAGTLPNRPSLPKANRPKGPAMDDLGGHTAKWDYTTADGKLICCVYRYDPPGGKKTFRPWDATRQKFGDPTPWPLYNQPGIAQADTVVLVEGEKCADALIQAGICATTTLHGAGGASKTTKTDWQPLAGKEVLVWPDQDEAGRKFAEAVAQAAAVVASSVSILIPPADKPEKWDAADAVAEGFNINHFLNHGERVPVQAPAAGPQETQQQDDQEDTRTRWVGEDAIALTFSARHGRDWRYVAQWGRWMFWSGKRWRKDETLHANNLIRRICREAANAMQSPKVGPRLATNGTASGVERLARNDRRHATTTDQWDADTWLLNTPGGTVDLRTGELRSHSRTDYITKITTATPQGSCPTWLRFLEEVTGGDKALIAYLARVIGYALTGSTREHALFFFYGTGANGKSVLLNVVMIILGDYATNAPMETFMETRSDRHPTDMAGLMGARLVTSIETEQGKRWAESKLKALTGGDPISARFMRQDFFEFTPQFKLLVAGNHRPAIRNIDEAMRRRLHLVPFTVTIPPYKRDHGLQEKLLAERDGILAWAVQGCLEWQQHGLNPPDAVLSATEAYFDAEDAVGRWITERCEENQAVRTPTARLYADWKRWAENVGEYAGSVKWFSEQLSSRRFTPWRNRVERGYQGIALRYSNHDYNDAF
ncbi:MAG: phage/plasmid primase, P4 family [Leptospirillia bacterium]